MSEPKKTLSAAIALAVIGTAAVAQTKQQEYEGKLRAAMEICEEQPLKATDIIWAVEQEVYGSKRFTEALTPMFKEAENCLNKTYQDDPYRWVSEKQKYMVAREIEAAAAKAEAKEAAKVAAEERAKREFEFEAELTSRIVDACYEVAKNDPLRAYTDPTCITVFKANGLP